MPRILPLYRERPTTPVEVERPVVCSRDCTRCGLSAARKLHNPCIAPEGEGGAGGLLVVSDYPGKTEDSVGRPFAGRTGRYLRPQLLRHWGGPIALDNAVKCYPGHKDSVTDDVIKACRGYLASTIATVKPSKILAMGQQAMVALLGRKLPPLSVRKGYGWAMVGDRLVPVYLFPNPVVAAQNRFLRRWFEEDLQWALTTDPPFAPAWDGEARVVETMADAEMADADIRAAGWFAYDVETSGFMWRAHQVLCASLCPAGRDYAWVWADKALGYKPQRQVMADLLRDPGVEVVGSNVKYDELATILDLKTRIRGVSDDTRLLRKVLDADADADLETMAELVGMGGHKEEMSHALVHAARVVGQIAKDNVSDQLELVSTGVRGIRDDVLKSIRPGERTKTYAYGFTDRDLCIRYNVLDTVTTGRLKIVLNQRREEDEPCLTRTYHNTVMPAARAIRQVEEWGALVDMDNVDVFREYLEEQKEDVLAQLEGYAGKGFNPNAYDDIRGLLFDKLGLESTHQTSGGKESTQYDVLEAMRHQHPAVGLVCDWRKVVKLYGTYAVGMMKHVRDDGRIHPTILPDGARSGRLACKDPNLQTIPRDSDSETGKMARDLFVAPPGYVMASIDYSQIELRVAAMLSGDPVMIQLFKDGRDFHQATAENIAQATWGITPDQVEKKHRTAAKSVNFGLLYGQGDDALAAILGCSKREAAKVREGVLGRFSVLAGWIRERLAEAKRTGYCWTWWDGDRARRRSLWKLADPDGYESSKAERGSWNSPIQGTASEYLVRSLTEVVNWILDEGVPAKVNLPVHDSLLLEIREDCLDEVLGEVSHIMTGWNSMDVPLVVDVEIGPSWGSLEKYAA